jgi:serine/threonine protein kinase
MTCKFCGASGDSLNCPENIYATEITFTNHHVIKPALLGEGVYGKIFYPSILSSHGTRLDGVSKVQPCDFSITEATIANHVKRFDKDGKYHMRILKSNIKPSVAWLCELNCESDHLINQFEHGGQTVLDVFRINDKFKETLLKLDNVFEGLELLHKNHVYHMDIKLANMVDHSGVFKLIDFGVSVAYTLENDSIKFLDTPIHDDVLYGYPYEIWPHELYLISPNVKSEFQICNEISALYNKNDWTNDYILAIHNDLKKQSTRDLLTLILPTVDVFSLAIMLITTCVSKKHYIENAMQFVDKHDLVHPDPKKRPTISKARKLFIDFFHRLPDL